MAAALVALASPNCKGRRQASPRAPADAGAAEPLQLAAPAALRALSGRLARALGQRRPPVRIQIARWPGRRRALRDLAGGRLDAFLWAAGPPGRGADAAGPLTAGPGRSPAGTGVRCRPLGRDPIVAIANATNRSVRLTWAQLRQVFVGQVRSWTEVGGDRLPLVPYLQGPGSPVRKVVLAQVLRGAAPGVTVRPVADADTVIASVRRTPGGIGLVLRSRLGVPARLPPGLKALALARNREDRGATSLEGQAAPQGQYALAAPVGLCWRTAPGSPGLRLGRVLETPWGAHLGAVLGLAP